MRYLDKKGKELTHGCLVKVYHFKGVNDQGRGRKHYYMYKVIVKLGKYWRGVHYEYIRDGGSIQDINEESMKGSYILPESRSLEDVTLLDYEVVAN
jgi:hypothetical protein